MFRVLCDGRMLNPIIAGICTFCIPAAYTVASHTPLRTLMRLQTCLFTCMRVSAYLGLVILRILGGCSQTCWVLCSFALLGRQCTEVC
jgi:hypothetical protein